MRRTRALFYLSDKEGVRTMFFHPDYLLFILPALLLSLWASFRTKSAFKKYSKVRTMRGLTRGADRAQSRTESRSAEERVAVLLDN